MAQGYAILGQRAKSLEQVAAVEPYLAPQAQDDQFQLQMERAIAGTFALLGNADSTIAHLRTLLKMPSGFTLNSARIDVNFRRLQGDPVWDRFLAGQ